MPWMIVQSPVKFFNANLNNLPLDSRISNDRTSINIILIRSASASHGMEAKVVTLLLGTVLLAAAATCASGQQYEALPKLSTPLNTPASPNPLSWSNFNYAAGNAAALPGPEVYSDGLSKGAVAGIVIGCVLGGLVLGALAMLCFLKRRRLFPQKYGPPKHPHEAGSIHALDVLRTGTKLDNMTKEELVSPTSFTVQHNAV